MQSNLSIGPTFKGNVRQMIVTKASKTGYAL